MVYLCILQYDEIIDRRFVELKMPSNETYARLVLQYLALNLILVCLTLVFAICMFNSSICYFVKYLRLRLGSCKWSRIAKDQNTTIILYFSMSHWRKFGSAKLPLLSEGLLYCNTKPKITITRITVSVTGIYISQTKSFASECVSQPRHSILLTLYLPN